MTVTIARWTLEDYHHLIETGLLEHRAVELLNGEIVEMPPEGEPHADASDETAEYLRELLGQRAKVREGHPITIPASDSEPEPDIAIVQRLAEGYSQHHPYPENIFWLIECSNSSLEKDLEAKAKAYASAGILEYWVVNLKKMELVVMRDPVNGKYQSKMVMTQGEIRPIAFPDISISVSQILRRR
jgi:Uma2 family endonuclease